MRDLIRPVIAGACALVMLAGLTVIAAPAAGAPPAQATPTLAGLSDFVIPTSTPAGELIIPTWTPAGGLVIPSATPGGGLVIPSATPGGLVIPTVTPLGPSLPLLDDAGLEALNLQETDVPADFAANRVIETFDANEAIAQIRDALPNVADRLQKVSDTYGWKRSKGISYTACNLSVPISEISSEVGQLSSVELARVFVDDPDLRAVLTELGFTLTDATSVHGMLSVSQPEAGACFPQEISYNLLFEYWGLFISVSMTANADTDPALVTGLLDQLAPLVVGRVDALATAPFPPTPVPGVVIAPTEVTVIIPTQTPQPIATTAAPTLAPTFALSPTPAEVAALTTLPDLSGIMPTIEEVGLPTDIFALNEPLSGSFTRQQIIAAAKQAGLTELAEALDQAGARNGLIGQEVRVWDTGSNCPDTVGLSVEVDVALFQTPQGAAAHLDDPGIQQAWINLGLVSTYEPTDDGGLLGTGTSPFHPCGTVKIYNKMMVTGRFMVSVVIIANEEADQQTVLSALDLFSTYMVEKIGDAGLE